MSNYIPRLYRFLGELSMNNNRPWFQQHKAEFDELRALWLADLDRLIAAIAEWDPETGRYSGRESAYRIYRDTRFSLDKTPYKTYFSAAFSPGGRKSDLPGYYLHMGPRLSQEGYPSGVYGGLWCPEGSVLKKLRRAIVDNIEEWEEILAEPELRRLYPGWVGETLKTAPAGWPKEHPQIEYLRLKEYGKFHQLDEEFFTDPAWPERTAELLRPLKPLIDFLAYSMTE
ncbi:MAG: DUF2461 domain-containing protein [Bacteroidales bacterium]|nr:DUF2461 domain-containing protein [Bacteroidales bacterium]